MSPRNPKSTMTTNRLASETEPDVNGEPSKPVSGYESRPGPNQKGQIQVSEPGALHHGRDTKLGDSREYYMKVTYFGSLP